MKRAKILCVSIALLAAAAACNGAPAFADQRSEANLDAKRSTTKPSIVRTWRDEMRLRFQEMTGFTRYIRGESPAKYF